MVSNLLEVVPNVSLGWRKVGVRKGQFPEKKAERTMSIANGQH